LAFGGKCPACDQFDIGECVSEQNVLVIQDIDHLQVSVRDCFASGRSGELERATRTRQASRVHDIGLILGPGKERGESHLVL